MELLARPGMLIRLDKPGNKKSVRIEMKLDWGVTLQLKSKGQYFLNANYQIFFLTPKRNPILWHACHILRQGDLRTACRFLTVLWPH